MWQRIAGRSQFLPQCGTPVPALSADGQRQDGATVQGPKQVGGDEIIVGDVKGVGMAFGRQAQATVTTGIAGPDLERLFAPLVQVLREAPSSTSEEAQETAEALKQEVAKGNKADDSKIGKLLDGLVGLVPSAASTVASMFATPILGGIAGPVTKFVLDKIQGK